MASHSDLNLIDFSAESPRAERNNENFSSLSGTLDEENRNIQVPTSVSIVYSDTGDSQSDDLNGSFNNSLSGSKGGKTNKSLFEITRVESHGGSVGGDDSEFDDTLSETHESSSTVMESVTRHSELEKTVVVGIKHTSKPNTLTLTQEGSDTTVTAVHVVSSTNSSTILVSAQSSTSVTNSQSATQTEAPSRFRIVKIAKSKPYDKGKWVINDFTDSQKGENNDVPASPMVKRTRHTTESGGGENKSERSKTITSPTLENVTSSEFLPNHTLLEQSRGSSYNNTGAGAERRPSYESFSPNLKMEPMELTHSVRTFFTNAFENKELRNTCLEIEVITMFPLKSISANEISGPIVTPMVTPMVEALETALDQIQSIKESMVSAVNDEVRKLQETLNALQLENNTLREDNELLRKRLTAAEERLHLLDQG